MENTGLELDTTKTFTLADLFGCVLSPKKSLTKQPKKNGKTVKRRGESNLSSFRLSNKLALQGSPKKNRKAAPATGDILVTHKEKLKFFESLQNTLPKKRSMLARSTDPSKRKQLEKEIQSIESREEEFAYIMNTGPILSEYLKASKEDSYDCADDNEDDAYPDRGGLTRFISKRDNLKKDSLTSQYYRIVDPDYVCQKELHVDNIDCRQCGKSNTVRDAYIVCTSCGFVSGSSSDFQMSYKDVQEISTKVPFSYKRANRFRECLSTLQAKENTDIPQHVIDAVQQEIQKEQITDLTTLDTPKIKGFLKRLGLVKYYEHSPALIIALNGLPPVDIPPHVEEQFNILFQAIQEPFEIVKKQVAPNRQNFLSYYYILYKFSELLGLDEYVQHFPLLKSTDKLRVQDQIWKGICEILEWDYRPSI